MQSDTCLTHSGRVTHICVDNLNIIGSDNGLSPSRRQAIIWTNVGILLIKPLGTNFSEILIEIITFSVKKMHMKMSSGKWRPFCLGLNVLINHHVRHADSIRSIWRFDCLECSNKTKIYLYSMPTRYFGTISANDYRSPWFTRVHL